jgi:hypothetical protein
VQTKTQRDPTRGWSTRCEGYCGGLTVIEGHGDLVGEADRKRGVFPDRLPTSPPRLELRRHQPGKRIPAFKGSVEPPISPGEDITTCLPPRCGDGLPITPSNRSGRQGSDKLLFCSTGSGNANAGVLNVTRRHPLAGVAHRGDR